MKKKIILCGLCFVLCFVITGCDNKLKVLSAEEEQTIVDYSAKMVAKYSKNKEDGICYIDASAETKEDSDKKTDSNDTNGSDKSKDDRKDNTDGASKISMTDALGNKNIEISYQGFDVLDSIQESTVFLQPDTGNKFFVLRFSMTNISGQEENLNMISEKIKSTVTTDSGAVASSMTTILFDDLSTFVGKLNPQETKRVMLVYQMDEQLAKSTQKVTLKLQKAENEYQISL